MVPVFAVLLVQDGGPTWWRLAAFAVFVVAAITDRVDGEIARSHNQVTDFGKIADPIADKALTGTALIVLSLDRRTVVVGHRRHPHPRIGHHRRCGSPSSSYGVIPASPGGKLKTVAADRRHRRLPVPAADEWYLQLPAHAIMAPPSPSPCGPGPTTSSRRLRLRQQARNGQPGEEAGRELARARPRTRRPRPRPPRRPRAHPRGRRVAHRRHDRRRSHRVPGASAVFRGGAVAYATETKATLLGVPAALLADHGAVHPEVATAMARGARRLFTATSASPSPASPDRGPQDGQPVGTVYAAAARPDNRCDLRKLQLHGDREAIREQTVAAALALLRDTLVADVAQTTVK